MFVNKFRLLRQFRRCSPLKQTLRSSNSISRSPFSRFRPDGPFVLKSSISLLKMIPVDSLTTAFHEGSNKDSEMMAYRVLKILY
jgi:hypothetical protein